MAKKKTEEPKIVPDAELPTPGQPDPDLQRVIDESLARHEARKNPMDEARAEVEAGPDQA